MPRERSSRNNQWIAMLLALIVIMILVVGGYIKTSPQIPQTGQQPQTSAPPGVSKPSTGVVPNWGQQAKTSGCQVSNGLPDSQCTPGDIVTNVTVDQICQPGYASSVRNVTTSEKDQVYAEYGIFSHNPGEYEVDHLVSLELGGSNDISNLWPEAASPKPGFHEKDKVENYLHDQVCTGKISLQEAQTQIATDWFQIYNSMP